MKKTHKLALGFGCLAAAAIFLMGNGTFVGKGQTQNDINIEFGIWTPETSFGQTFTALHDQLSRIDFWIDSYRPWDSPSLECRLYEIDIDQSPNNLTYDVLRARSREMRHTRLNGWLLSPHMFNACRFDPIPNSAGKRYMLTIRSPELRRGGTSILRGSYRKRLETEAFFVNGEKKERNDLAFRPLYTRSRPALIQASIRRLVLQKAFPFSQPAFISLLLGLYLILLVLLAWLLYRSKSHLVSK